MPSLRKFIINFKNLEPFAVKIFKVCMTIFEW